MIDACLVYMPHQPPQNPSDTIGLLSAQLKQRGHSVKAVYANLRFLECAPPAAGKLGLFGEDVLIGDWACARDVFGGDDSNLDDYVAYLQRAESSFRNTTAAVVKKALLRFREQSESFLDALVSDVLAMQPRIVVCVIDHLQTMTSLAFLKRVKARNPKIVTATCTVANDETIAATLKAAFAWIDVAIGPADALGGDLNALPVPDHDDYFLELASLPRLRAAVQPRIPVTMSRGCRPAAAAACFFCGLPTARRTHERKSIARILQELDDLHARHGVDRFLITDPMAEIDLLQPILTACAARGRAYRFFCQVSPGLTRAEVRLLAEGGVEWVQPGIESLDSRILELANKKTRAWQNIQFLRSCGEFGLRVNWNLLYGFPGEEDGWYEEMARMIPALAHLQPPRAIGRVRLCRQSAYFDRAREFHVEPVVGEAARLIYPPSPGIVEGLTQYFDDGVRRRQDSDDLAFISRLGFFSLRKSAVQWRERFRGASRPRLVARRVGSGMLVEDTRPIARAAETSLDDVEASLLEACREAPPAEVLIRRAREHGTSEAQVRTSIRGLMDKQFVVSTDGRMVSLVLDGAAV